MARMIPSEVKDFHESEGERRTFYALRGLSDSITVIHSLRWLHPGRMYRDGEKINPQGEGDFVIVDPERGILTIEVKGGDIWCRQGEWHQRNRRTGEVKIIEPEVQASNTSHRIRTELQGRLPEAAKLLFGHAVWFPDGVPDRSELPMNCPTEIVLDEDDLARPESAIGRAFAYWRNRFPGRGAIPDGKTKAVLDALAPTMSLVPSIRRSTDAREAELVRLTREQARIVEFLDEQRHAAIHGAAGTGKTMIALEKARRIASPSEPVLFLCYNSALRRHLQRRHASANVAFATFHSFAREITGADGSFEDAEARLLEHLISDRPLPYAHLVVDEGQDFKAEWLEYLGHAFRDGAFYVFYDRNQLVQGGNLSLLDDIPCRLVLTKNCRNTDEIARLAYRAGDLAVAPTLGVSGPKPLLHRADTSCAAAALAVRLVVGAIRDGKLPPHEIAVLTLETRTAEALGQTLKVDGLRIESDPEDGCVTVTTARRFKGLEAALVIVPDVHFRNAADPDWRRRLYVACSRARQGVHLITTVTEGDLKEVIPLFAKSERVRPGWKALERALGLKLAEEEEHASVEH